MMKLYLVDKIDGTKLDLGVFDFDDEANCIKAAQKRHKKFLDGLETHRFEFKSERYVKQNDE